MIKIVRMVYFKGGRKVVVIERVEVKKKVEMVEIVKVVSILMVLYR